MIENRFYNAETGYTTYVSILDSSGNYLLVKDLSDGEEFWTNSKNVI